MTDTRTELDDLERDGKEQCPRCGEIGFASSGRAGTINTETMEFSKLCHGDWGVFFHA